jgi:hypothetical protein
MRSIYQCFVGGGGISFRIGGGEGDSEIWFPEQNINRYHGASICKPEESWLKPAGLDVPTAVGRRDLST